MTDTPPESITDAPSTDAPATPSRPAKPQPPTQDDPDAPGLSVLTGSMADPQDAAEPNEPA